MPQSQTSPWSIGLGWKMDGPGQDYPDTPRYSHFFMCFFAFQAILNTFYFWVKNLEKKIF